MSLVCINVINVFLCPVVFFPAVFSAGRQTYLVARSQRTVTVTHYEGQIENNITTSDTNTRVGIGPTYCIVDDDDLL